MDRKLIIYELSQWSFEDLKYAQKVVRNQIKAVEEFLGYAKRFKVKNNTLYLKGEKLHSIPGDRLFSIFNNEETFKEEPQKAKNKAVYQKYLNERKERIIKEVKACNDSAELKKTLVSYQNLLSRYTDLSEAELVKIFGTAGEISIIERDVIPLLHAIEDEARIRPQSKTGDRPGTKKKIAEILAEFIHEKHDTLTNKDAHITIRGDSIKKFIEMLFERTRAFKDAGWDNADNAENIKQVLGYVNKKIDRKRLNKD